VISWLASRNWDQMKRILTTGTSLGIDPPTEPLGKGKVWLTPVALSDYKQRTQMNLPSFLT
jgi:hypothetical protein